MYGRRIDKVAVRLSAGSKLVMHGWFRHCSMLERTGILFLCHRVLSITVRVRASVRCVSSKMVFMKFATDDDIKF